MKILPLFLPFAGCTGRCIFCDEHLLTGQQRIPEIPDLIRTLEEYRIHLKPLESYQVAFYGGSFLSLSDVSARMYIESVLNAFSENELEGIRLSTTPESITKSSVDMLSQFPVSLVEIGVQSFDDHVLKLARRPHSVHDVYKAADLLKSAGIAFGIHLMTGLPGSTIKTELFSATEAVRIGAALCRLNPTLVLEETGLHKLLRNGLYKAQTLDEAIESLWRMYVLLEGNGVKVIRIGLCLNSKRDRERVVSGPYHPAIGDLVLSRVAFEMLFLLCSEGKKRYISLPVTQQQKSFFTGHRRMVERLLERSGIRVEYKIVNDAVLDTSQLLEDLCFCVSGGEVNEAFLDPPERVQELCASDEAQHIGRDNVSCRT